MPTIRKYLRGYNHTEALATSISNQTHIPVSTTTLVKNTSQSKKRQVLTKSRSERLKNQHNAFRINGTVLGDKIILIDDVTTTGATLDEARKILLSNGALSVEAFTIAH